MTNKQNNNKKQNVLVQNRKKKRGQVAETIGSIIGAGAGIASGIPFAPLIGSLVGGGIGSLIGSGQYTYVGPKPGYNVLVNPNQIPRFSTNRVTNVVSHREYLGDILGDPAFVNRQLPLNPGISSTFPWLSTIAQNYQEYKFHGLVFEFKSLVTDFVTGGAPGALIMATNYNSDAPPFTTKQEMENSEFATSTKPTCNLLHGIECAVSQTVFPHLFVRTSGIGPNLDLKTLDQGLFQLATQSNPSQNLGELWVTYVVEFFKPVLPIDVGGNISSAHIRSSSVAPATPLGAITTINSGDLLVVKTSTSLSFPVQPQNKYMVTLAWLGSSVGSAAYPNVTVTTGVIQSVFAQSTVLNSPRAGSTTLDMQTTIIFTSTALNPEIVLITFGNSGVFPTGTTSCDIVVTPISTELV